MAVTLVNEKAIGKLTIHGEVIVLDVHGVEETFKNINEFILHYFGDNHKYGFEQTRTIVTGYYEGILDIPFMSPETINHSIKVPLTPIELKMPSSGQLKSVMNKLYNS